MGRARGWVFVGVAVAACWAGASEADGQDSTGADDATREEPGPTLVPLPVVFYQPETGLGFGVAARYYTRLTEAPPEHLDLVVPPSMFQLVGVYTLEKQIITQLSGELYLNGTRYRSNAELGYVKFPTLFWGIGNDTPDDAEEEYTPERLNVLSADVQRELSRGWYAGLMTRAVFRRISEVEEGGQLDSGEVPGSDDGWATGLGALATRDTRSSTTYPTSGTFHQVHAVFHGRRLGDFAFGSYLLDLRRYISLGGRKVMALQGQAMASSGTPPLDALPQIGGDRLLRGYFQGRFTDRQLVAVQAEYRGPVVWRVGWAAFGGVGQVADAFGDLKRNGFKTSFGAGLRFLVSDQEGLFIRADLGYGVETGTTGFYLQIGEAF